MAELSVKEQMEQMLAGTHEDVIEDEMVEETDIDEEEDVDEAVDNTEEEVVEDTDQEEDTEEDEDTDDSDDDSDEETSDEEVDDEEEDTQTTETDDESDNVDGDSDEEVDTEAEKPETTDEVNYKEFYEKVALAKFTANGREVEGFKNPEDLIRAQQMLHGYSDKMKVFKEYKKFIKPLEERKITADPDKFNLAMSLLDGDVEAIKKVIKDKGIDPLEMDLEDIKYTQKDYLPNETQLMFDETIEQAKELGIEEKFNKALTKDFDDASFKEFVDNPLVRRDLMQHLQDGTYDIVQNEIKSMELLDTAGQLNGMSTVDKYRAAVNRLQQRSIQEQPVKVEPKVDKVADEKARIDKERVAEEFKRKAAEKEAKIAEERKKAASVSKKKVVKRKVQEVKPEALKGDQFRDYFKNMLMS